MLQSLLASIDQLLSLSPHVYVIVRLEHQQCHHRQVGSIADNTGGSLTAYRASKTALNMVMKNLSIEYKVASSSALVNCFLNTALA